MDPENTGDTGIDIEAAAASIGANLFKESEQDEAAPEDVQASQQHPETEVAAASDQPTTPSRPAPKAWPKEMHDKWGTLSPEVQDYLEVREKQMLDGLEQYKEHYGFGKSMRDVVMPYKPILDALGLDEQKAIGYLLNAHYRLTQGTPEQRAAAYQHLGESLGLVQRSQSQADQALQPLLEKVSRIESQLIERENAAFAEARSRISRQVEDFANEKDAEGNAKHPYFDDVADDIVAFIDKGMELKDAYERAVYANPATREKEFARLQKQREEQLRAKSKEEAERARKATSANVRSRDTKRAPTESLGTMDDTLQETLAAIRSRTH
jgi:hypothetical protein